MSPFRQVYYDLFSELYDFVIRLHSRDREGALRSFITEKTHLSEGDWALDLCTGTGSVALELAKQVGIKGSVVARDFSRGMLEKAKQKAVNLGLNHLRLVQGNASHLPFKSDLFNGVTCSHAFYELKGPERLYAIEEVARVLKEKGRFCLMEHAKPEKFLPRVFFYVRLFFLGSKDVKKFLEEEESIFGERFKNVSKERSSTGQSKLTCGEKRG